MIEYIALGMILGALYYTVKMLIDIRFILEDIRNVLAGRER